MARLKYKEHINSNEKYFDGEFKQKLNANLIPNTGKLLQIKVDKEKRSRVGQKLLRKHRSDLF